MLVATDIAARGIDVEEIAHVVNFDLPNVPEDYVHRVGRTARMAADGKASSFCSPDEQPLLRDIERFTRRTIELAEVPRSSPAFREAIARRSEFPENEPPRRHSQRRQRPASQRSAPAEKSPGERPRLVGSFRPRRRR